LPKPYALGYQLNLPDIFFKPKQGYVSKLGRTSFPLFTHMRKLLTAAFLVASCTLHQANAQKSTTPDKTSAATPTTPPGQVPDWVAAEFGEAYAHYFLDLPAFYRYTVGQTLRNSTLASNADLSNTLAQNTALREAVYQTIYQYCHALKYGLGNTHEVDKLIYLMLYSDLHLGDLAAIRLAPYISSRYKQPVPTPQYSAYPVVKDAPDKRATATSAVPSSSSNTMGPGAELSGWRFESAPVVEAVSDEEGAIRFKLTISDKGEVESVTKVSGNVSPAQEKLCRDALLNAHLVRSATGSGGATGFYTFRFTVR
jgi:hypothetical protein